MKNVESVLWVTGASILIVISGVVLLQLIGLSQRMEGFYVFSRVDTIALRICLLADTLYILGIFLRVMLGPTYQEIYWRGLDGARPHYYNSLRGDLEKENTRLRTLLKGCAL
jgi:hypothetical protein